VQPGIIHSEGLVIMRKINLDIATIVDTEDVSVADILAMPAAALAEYGHGLKVTADTADTVKAYAIARQALIAHRVVDIEGGTSRQAAAVLRQDAGKITSLRRLGRVVSWIGLEDAYVLSIAMNSANWNRKEWRHYVDSVSVDTFTVADWRKACKDAGVKIERAILSNGRSALDAAGLGEEVREAKVKRSSFERAAATVDTLSKIIDGDDGSIADNRDALLALIAAASDALAASDVAASDGDALADVA